MLKVFPPHRYRKWMLALLGITLQAGHATAACTNGNLVVDGGFETTNPSTLANANWTATSTQFGSPLCNAANCGTQGGVAARAGTFWAWFGGSNGTGAETATLTQQVTFPSNASVTLRFYLWINLVATPFTDVLNVKIDGATRLKVNEPDTAESGYTLRSVDLSDVTPTAHTLKLEYVQPAVGGSANFLVDDVTIDVVCNDELFKNGFDP